MDAWVPFFQTLLWILLIGGSLWCFHSQVVEIIESIRDRVHKGGTVKAGPFELGESPPAQSEASQRQELKAEVSEATGSNDEAAVPLPQLHKQAFLAEELAVRELQSEFGLSINRQVAVGQDAGFDGMFVTNGHAYGVEVKFTRRKLPDEIARNTIHQVKHYAARLGWRSFTLVLAIVQDNPKLDTSTERTRIEKLVYDIDKDVFVRVYDYQLLASKYGIADGG